MLPFLTLQKMQLVITTIVNVAESHMLEGDFSLSNATSLLKFSSLRTECSGLHLTEFRCSPRTEIPQPFSALVVVFYQLITTTNKKQKQKFLRAFISYCDLSLASCPTSYCAQAGPHTVLYQEVVKDKMTTLPCHPAFFFS